MWRSHLEIKEAVLRRPFIAGGRVYHPSPGGQAIGFHFHRNIGISIHDAMLVNADNQRSMALVKHPVFHDGSKHINTQYHFTHDLVKEGRTSLNYVLT